MYSYFFNIAQKVYYLLRVI